MALAIPVLRFVEVRVVGRLFLPDALMLLSLPFVVTARGRSLRGGLPRTFVGLGLLWLLGQVVTDLVRQSAFEDYARGWAKIGLFLVSFTVLYSLLHTRRRLVLYALGIAIAGILAWRLNPDPYAALDAWKFGVGGSITLLMILAGLHRSFRWLQVALLAGAAFLNLYMGFRSLAGVCFLTTAYTMLTPKGAERPDNKGFAFLVLVTLGAGLGFLKAYEYAATHGVLGAAAEQKYEQQAGGRLGVILGARSEILVSARAIQDSPIIGHGSWARNPEYADLGNQFRALLGYESTWAPPNPELIPTHSHLLGAWVEAGILGALFWLWMVYLSVRALVSLRRSGSPLTPLIAFAGFLLLWDVLFSPFGAERRFITPYYAVLLMTALDRPSTDRRRPPPPAQTRDGAPH